jgi:hypothetical protein
MNNKKINKYFNMAYYGGRCEIFGNPYKKEKIYYYDFFSMYPSVMRKSYPITPGKLEKNPKEIKYGFYLITFISNNKIPVMPIRKNSKLYFLNGKIKG